MSKVQLAGNVSGTGIFTIASPNSNIDRTLTLPDNTGTLLTQNSQPSFASTIGVGGATPANTGAGITFPATVSLSSDANTLDDYEEGTFTPTITGSVSNPTIINPAFSAKYTRIGRQVTIHFYLQGGRTGGTGSGDLKIGNMPFPINTGDDGAGAVITYGVNCGVSSTYVGVRRFDNTTVGLLGSNNLGGTWVFVQAGNLDTGLWAIAAQYIYTTA